MRQIDKRRIKNTQALSRRALGAVLVCVLFVSSVNPSLAQDSNHDQMIKDHYVHALMKMAEQSGITSMMQLLGIGMFFDAKEQLETQRDIRKLKAEAHKDYHPSEQICQIGSSIRSVGQSAETSSFAANNLNEILAARYLNRENTASDRGQSQDYFYRFEALSKQYCNPSDFSGDLEGVLCLIEEATERMNNDIDYAAALGVPVTLDGVNFSNLESTAEEADILALGKNLYWHKVGQPITDPNLENAFLERRRQVAVMNVAHQSFVKMAAMKGELDSDTPETSGPAFMKAYLKQFGIEDEDQLDAILGEKPSYWAQMEFLTNKMLQSPDFYTNLYDKPVNVDRSGVALQAIQLMQARDAYESQLRREMLLSQMAALEANY